MKKNIFTASALLLCALCLRAAAQDNGAMNALMIVDSDSAAFNKGFQKFLADNGARFTDAFPPHAFLGYVPGELDAALARDHGAVVYRARIEDMTVVARYGENAFFAVNVWNKHFVDDPPAAPLVVSHKVSQVKKGDAITLSWNEVMRATDYKLQISSAADFSAIVLETLLKRNSYAVYPAFFRDGVYYWRVSGLLTLNSGERREGRFSDTYSFVVSKSAKAAARAPMTAPSVPASARLKGRPLTWPENPAFKYYRLQLSLSADFSSTVADVFTDKEAFKLSNLHLKPETRYYMRVMGSDGVAPGTWSSVSEITAAAPAPIARDMRRPARKK